MNKIIFILTLSAFLFSQQAEVTNIQAAQRTDGSQIVDIYYDLLPDEIFQAFTVTVQASFDNGNSFLQLTNISGHFGDGIVASTDSLHRIIWNLGEQYPNVFFEDVIINIIAESTINTETPFEMVTIPSGSFNNCGTEDEINYDYNIMTNEVTNAQYAEFLIGNIESGNVYHTNQGDYWSETYGYYEGDGIFPPGFYPFYLHPEPEEMGGSGGDIDWNGTTYIVEEGMGNNRVDFVTWFGARMFAIYHGIRLPMQDEWIKANALGLIDVCCSNWLNDGVYPDSWNDGFPGSGYQGIYMGSGCGVGNEGVNQTRPGLSFRCISIGR